MFLFTVFLNTVKKGDFNITLDFSLFIIYVIITWENLHHRQVTILRYFINAVVQEYSVHDNFIIMSHVIYYTEVFR